MPGIISSSVYSSCAATLSHPNIAATPKADIWFDARDYEYIKLEDAWFDASETLPDEQNCGQKIVPLTEDCQRCFNRLVRILADVKQNELLAAALARLMPGLPVNILMAANNLYVAIVERKHIDIGVLSALGLVSACLPDDMNLISRLAAFVREIIISHMDASLLWLLQGEDESGHPGHLCTALAILAVAARYCITDADSPQRHLLNVPIFIANLFVRAGRYLTALGNMAGSRLSAPEAAQQQPAFVQESFVETSWKGCTDSSNDAGICPSQSAVISDFSANLTVHPGSLTTATVQDRLRKIAGQVESPADRMQRLAVLNLMRESKLSALLNCLIHKTETSQARSGHFITKTYFNMQCGAVANRAANIETLPPGGMLAAPDRQLISREDKVALLQRMVVLTATTVLSRHLHAAGGTASAVAALAGMASAATAAIGVTTQTDRLPSGESIGKSVHEPHSVEEFKRISENTISYLGKIYHPVLNPIEYINNFMLNGIRQYEENSCALSGLTPQSKITVTLRPKNLATQTPAEEKREFSVAEIVTGAHQYKIDKMRHASGRGYEVKHTEHAALFRLIDAGRLTNKITRALSEYRADSDRVINLKKYYQSLVVLRCVQFLERHPDLPDEIKAVEEFLAAKRQADGLTFHGVKLNGVFAVPCSGGNRTILFSVSEPATFTFDISRAIRKRVPITPVTKAFRDFVREKMPFFAAVKYAGEAAFYATNRNSIILNGRMQPVTIQESDFSFTESSSINALGDRLFDNHIKRLNADIDSLLLTDEAQRNEKWLQAASTLFNPPGHGLAWSVRGVPKDIGTLLSALNNRFLQSAMADGAIADKTGERADGAEAHLKEALYVMSRVSGQSDVAYRFHNVTAGNDGNEDVTLYRQMKRLADKELPGFLISRSPVKTIDSEFLNTKSADEILYKVQYGKRIIDMQGGPQELFYNSEARQYEVDSLNETGAKVRLPVYMEKLSYRWHPAWDNNVAIFSESDNAIIDRLHIPCDKTMYRYSHVNNLNHGYYGNGKIVEVRKADASPYSKSALDVIEINGQLVPVKFDIITGHGMKYDIHDSISDNSWPISWDGKRWVFEQPTSALISTELMEKITPDMFSDIKSSLISTPGNRGLQYSNDGKTFLKIKNRYIEIVPTHQESNYIVNKNITVRYQNGKYHPHQG